MVFVGFNPISSVFRKYKTEMKSQRSAVKLQEKMIQPVYGGIGGQRRFSNSVDNYGITCAG
jgi:hypothetical protein